MALSFDAVFEAEFDRLHAYLARRVGISAADDLTAETFAVAFRRWSDLTPGRPARPWLYGIAANLARHHWRKEQRMLRAYSRTGRDPVAAADDPSSVDRLDAQRAGAAIASALKTLRRAEREVLLLHAWAELSDAEIADALSLPIGTVKSRLNRARKRFWNQLNGNGKVTIVDPTLATGEKI